MKNTIFYVKRVANWEMVLTTATQHFTEYALLPKKKFKIQK